MLLLAEAKRPIDLELELYRAAAAAKRELNAFLSLVEGEHGYQIRRVKGETISSLVQNALNADAPIEDAILRLNELSGKAEIIEPLSARALDELFEDRPVYANHRHNMI